MKWFYTVVDPNGVTLPEVEGSEGLQKLIAELEERFEAGQEVLIYARFEE